MMTTCFTVTLMPDRNNQKEDQTSIAPKDYGDDAQQEKTILGVRNLVAALCEEPFEAEVEDEDVSDLKAELMACARRYTSKLEELRAGNQEPPPQDVT